MKLLVDENVARVIVDELSRRGHDVMWVARDAPGISDGEVFRSAYAQGRIILTYDKGHGRRAHTEAAMGVIIVRDRFTASALYALVLAEVIDSRSDWGGHISVIQHGRVRRRPTPPIPS